jgi:hypothetical protein
MSRMGLRDRLLQGVLYIALATALWQGYGAWLRARLFDAA